MWGLCGWRRRRRWCCLLLSLGADRGGDEKDGHHEHDEIQHAEAT
jgi:hypothetical protein